MREKLPIAFVVPLQGPTGIYGPSCLACGELAEGSDLDALAWYYLGVVQAIVNLPQAGASIAAMQRMVEVAMSVWPPPQVA